MSWVAYWKDMGQRWLCSRTYHPYQVLLQAENEAAERLGCSKSACVHHLARIFRLFALIYACWAIVYTTTYLILMPDVVSLAIPLKSGSVASPFIDDWLKVLSGPNLTASSWLHSTASSLFKPTAGVVQHELSWLPNEKTAKELGLRKSTIMIENILLAKAFSQSMQPSKIIPYYYRASSDFERDDVTITTLVTSNRLKVFSQLVERYRGPISVTVHVKSESDRIESFLQSLHILYTSSPLMSTFVDVHLVIDAFDRQFNTWRNIARMFSRTDYFMMLDVDFVICTDFRTAIQNALRDGTDTLDGFKNGTMALVVPAFEYTRHKDGYDQKIFPRTKKSLLSLVKSRRIGMFHRSWGPGHNSTDYERFYASLPGEIYKVTTYQSAYEPYVILRRDGPPWCDERFVGYGGNKAACLFEMYLSGISFYVLADHFLVHQNHAYEEAARKLERKNNRKIYWDFKEETCVRYLKRHFDAGILKNSIGSNVLEECKKIKGMSRIAAHVVDGIL